MISGLDGFMVSFIAVGLAELGDKTQLSILLLSSKTKHHLSLLLGVVLAFLIVDGVAVLAGSWVASVISPEMLKLVSGPVFIIFGLLILKGGVEGMENKIFSKNPLLAGFMLIMLTEWGDKTQIAAGLLAMDYTPVMVLAGAVLSLALLSLAAIYLGKYISKKIDRSLMTKIAGIIFIIIGVATLLL